MKNYHFTYKDKRTDKVCTGITIKANSEIEALEQFNYDHMNKIFIYMVNKEEF